MIFVGLVMMLVCSVPVRAWGGTGSLPVLPDHGRDAHATGTPDGVTTNVLAFPGAQGFGAYAQGGRGGRVYHVTTLEDGGAGSLREAVEAAGPRIVVFDVSGTIRLKKDLKIMNPFITIAGQTAPGGGICLRDGTLRVYADQVIIRFLRCRLGDQSGTGDAISLCSGYNIIVDHCSASWSQDEVGGWPDLQSVAQPPSAGESQSPPGAGVPPLDSDGDGMPDEWEQQHGLNPNDAADGPQVTDARGYTNVEVYLNALVP